MASEVNVKIVLAMPQQVHEQHRAKTLRAQVMEAINNIESGSEHCEADWALLRRVVKSMMHKGDISERNAALMHRIQNLMAKYDQVQDITD